MSQLWLFLNPGKKDEFRASMHWRLVRQLLLWIGWRKVSSRENVPWRFQYFCFRACSRCCIDLRKYIILLLLATNKSIQIYNCIDKFRTGEQIMYKICGEQYQNAYEAILRLISLVNGNSYHKRKWDKARELWAQRGMWVFTITLKNHLYHAFLGDCWIRRPEMVVSLLWTLATRISFLSVSCLPPHICHLLSCRLFGVHSLLCYLHIFFIISFIILMTLMTIVSSTSLAVLVE